MKIYKILFAVVLTLTIAFSLTGCREIQKAETAVNGMFTELKNLDFKEVQKYVDIDSIVNSDNVNENILLVMETIFDNLSYEITSSQKINDTNVVVKTNIIVTDMRPVMADFFTKSMQYVVSNTLSTTSTTEEETNKKMKELLIECASKPNLATISNEIEISVIKNENNEWKIDADETFLNTILGGFMDATKKLQASLDIE